ncbi:MAG TPA: hypothetical protein VMY77_00650 [Chitinophagaceae bacterium]|nr:hypothetical protein [Chitinophagaceae bacterium]
METHHPHHITHKKKWGEYLLEFFMLFLAVFLGFIAENQREHLVEQQREKQFMSSLMEDLEKDTAELHYAIRKADSVVVFSDSAILFLRSYKFADTVSARLAPIIRTAGLHLRLINTDRTSSQLKNSGAMRLVRQKNVTDVILFYWKQVEETGISLGRYMKYRDAGREIVFKLWVIPEAYKQGLKVNEKPVQSLRVIDTDSKKWDELVNLIAMSSAIVKDAHLPNLKLQLEIARHLIELIKREYRLS